MPRENRIGIFICHCGHNISTSVDIETLKKECAEIPGVALVEDYKYMCSTPGQELVAESILRHNLTGLVMANCSPNLHERTFRNVAAKAGLNPYLVEVANIREHCSWPHWNDHEAATKKALKIIKSITATVKQNAALEPIRVEVEKTAMVIGGGIAGIQSALDIADAGYRVHLVEKEPTIGGKMVQLSETFPTLDCPQCILTPKMTDVANHPNITLHAYSEVESVEGYVGDFKVKLRKKASYVDADKCTGCGECSQKCPNQKIPSEFDRGVGTRPAIYTPFPQAVPNIPVIDRDNCIHFKTGKCGVCQKICPVDAVDFEMEDRIIELKVGAIVVATGFDLYPLSEIGEYGYGEIPDVLDPLAFERLMAASGPTAGKLKRPSDGKIPKKVVFIQCVRSRDPEHGMAYCSRVCCMYTAKEAMLYRHAVPDGEAYVFYIDIRSNGRMYEEFVQRAREEDGVKYLRGKVARVFENEDKVEVWGVDTLTGRQVKIKADMVVLAPAMVPATGVKELAVRLRLPTDEYGWIKEAHLKLRPLESLTAGIFLAGACQYPKDITDTASQASGAASKVQTLFSRPTFVREPLISRVDQDICAGCGACEDVCPYDAIEVQESTERARVNEALCEGCGSCASACPSGAVEHINFKTKQIIDMVYMVTED